MAKKENLSNSLIEKAKQAIIENPEKTVIPLGMSSFLVKQGNYEDLEEVLRDNVYQKNGEVNGFDVIDSLDPLS